MDEATRLAQERIVAAREELGVELDGLEAAARDAVDIRGKIRRYPARTAALAGGAAFMVVKGPQRVARRVVGALHRKSPAPRSLLPNEVERIVSKLGADGDAIRAALERDFADYIEAARKGRKKAPPRGAMDSFWRLFDGVSGPLAARAGREMAARLFAQPGGGSPPPQD